ncbi:hypothetical protein BCR36DRAFT_295243 [Piromyces finnis]|uniref:Uncharacterized protein n=1 Tax=Piromyces finnis TaxID=1754191 RepID=A0A1Y1V5C9_9FUNG|nr:hypothetical protein BCR36DRAFT_295243 [Piromyces finnis]|eukprot:ORX47641.1 hypothetical protein BCR36DRAFT_295243 [Piromyces finnis]
MQYLLILSEHSNGQKLKVDGYQYVINSYICNSYFPWVCLIILLNFINWKRPIILILILHWFFRSTGDLLRNTMELRPMDDNMYWPYSQKNWYISNAVAHIFWLLGEIIGDWYPLIRTKAVTLNKEKLKFVYTTCILHNLVKVIGMYCYFMKFPIDLRHMDENGNLLHGITQYSIAWWSTVSLMQISSLLYDLSVISALKTCLFNKIEEYKTFIKNTFLDKFKQISEFRIFFSMIFSIAFLPFVITFVIYLLSEFKKNNTLQYASSDTSIEQLRQVVLNFNYTLMYIDQALLLYFIRKTNHPSEKNLSFSLQKPPSNNSIQFLNYSKIDFTNNNSNTNNSISQMSKNIYGTLVSPKLSNITSLNINDYYPMHHINHPPNNIPFYDIKEKNNILILDIHNNNESSLSNLLAVNKTWLDKYDNM